MPTGGTVEKFGRAAEAEQLQGPELIQKTKATRFRKKRWARTTQNAPEDVKITANLLSRDGIEITEGEGVGIDVYCDIIGGGNLNAAVPRLIDDQDIPVVKRTIDVDGTPTERWYYDGWFNASVECE